MGLNVLRYEVQGRAVWGVVRDGAITPIPGEYPTTGDFLREGRARAFEAASGGARPSLEERAVRVLSPVTRNQQFVCQGVNYKDHLREVGMDPDAKVFNMIFRKASSCLAPPCTEIVKPAHVKLLDYEIELGVVIGKEIAGPVEIISRNLHEFVAGVVITNDITARDIQIPQMQFYKGKSYRTFGPTGPYLCLLEPGDVQRLDDLRLTLRVNDEVRQDASTAEMVYSPAETLTELSGVMDLFPGDLLATGTPGGVALKVPGPISRTVANLLPERLRWKAFLRSQSRNPLYLKAGDRIRSAIRSADGKIDLGVQENRVVTG